MISREIKILIGFFLPVFLLLGLLIFGGMCLLQWGDPSCPYAGIPLTGDAKWYRNVGGRVIPEIQDEDLFFHNIGESVQNAKNADMVILGSSTTARLDRELINNFAARHGIKIYNMSFVGIRGGEFTRQIIKKWDIKAPLWVINSDDCVIPFFSHETKLTFGPKATPINAMGYSRPMAFIEVYARNIRWRIQDLKAVGWLGWRKQAGIYRNIDDGSAYIDNDASFVAKNNSQLKVERTTDLQLKPEIVDVAKDYLKDIGGRAVLILVPHSQESSQQLHELSEAVGVEAILPPTLTPDYTTTDGGGHLDKRGSAAYTQYLVSELEKTQAFKDLLDKKKTLPQGK